MADFLAPILGLKAAEDVFLRVTVSLIILVLGHLAAKSLKSLLRRLWIDPRDLNKKESEDRLETLQYLQYVMDAGVILGALLYLNTGITTSISSEFASFLPRLMTVAMVAILGFIGINLFSKVLKEFLKAVGTETYLREVGLTRSTLDIGTGVLRFFLYLMLAQISLEQLGIGETFITELVTASSWAVAVLVAGLVFYGLKDLFSNAAAGIYLKNSRRVRPGEEVRLGDEIGEIDDVSLFSTELKSDEGYTLLKPNKEVMDSEVRVKRTKNDLETLEEIKSYFVSQSTETSKPAVFEMALDILGYQSTQEELADEEEVEKLVEKRTNDEVRTSFVERDKISNLGDELKAWFNDGALVEVQFPRNGDETSRHVLAAGVEQGEVLVIDPDADSGGVYFVDQSTILEAMEDGDGYTVIAPKGTTSYWRLKKELIYSDRTYYDELSKTLEARLNKIMRQGRLMKDVMPGPVRNYVEEWRSGRYASKLWQPDGGEDEASEDE